VEDEEAGGVPVVPDVVPAAFAAEVFVLVGCFGALADFVHAPSVQQTIAIQTNRVKICCFINIFYNTKYTQIFTQKGFQHMDYFYEPV